MWENGKWAMVYGETVSPSLEDVVPLLLLFLLLFVCVCLCSFSPLFLLLFVFLLLRLSACLSVIACGAHSEGILF